MAYNCTIVPNKLRWFVLLYITTYNNIEDLRWYKYTAIQSHSMGQVKISFTQNFIVKDDKEC